MLVSLILIRTIVAPPIASHDTHALAEVPMGHLQEFRFDLSWPPAKSKPTVPTPNPQSEPAPAPPKPGTPAARAATASPAAAAMSTKGSVAAAAMATSTTPVITPKAAAVPTAALAEHTAAVAQEIAAARARAVASALSLPGGSAGLPAGSLGVSAEEIGMAVRPIERVGTSIAAFLGESPYGPRNEPVLVKNWGQYCRFFGELHHAPNLAHAVFGYFNNGGDTAFVCNVAPQSPAAEKPVAAEIKHYLGADLGPGQRSGIHVFNDIPEISIVCAPGRSEPAIWEAVLSHCETMRNRFAILDTAAELGKSGMTGVERPRDSAFGAVYFPWIQVFDPELREIAVPPSGHIAGLYARTDAERGVHKAPANDNLRGALGLKYTITQVEQNVLAPRGINCIVREESKGTRVVGARTLSNNRAWRTISVRRLFLMLEASIEAGTEWAIFEPRDTNLLKSVRRNITAFLLRVYSSGALAGKSPEEAFYVKCDEENNPPDLMDAGQLVCEVGISPLKAAEFIIMRISHLNKEAN